MTLSPDSVHLDDTVAIVTGAAVGIGRACATALALFGATVAMCDRDELNLAKCVAEIEAAGGEVYPGVLDVRDADAVRTWVEGAGAAGSLVFIAVYAVATTVLFLPGAVITLVGGALIGPLWGT